MNTSNPDMFRPPLVEMLSRQEALQKHGSICLWSDLLGFGSPLKGSNWQPTDDVWYESANRLFLAQREFILNLGVTAKLLILNDGLGCAIDADQKSIGEIAHFVMECIRTHMYINTLERRLKRPGTRSVLAFGKRIEYISPEFHIDDYIARYSRPDPKGMSTVAQSSGNPTVVSIPSCFQMNTAFSKAFLVDEAGSKQGVSGNGFFIDQSFFEFVNSRLANADQIRWEGVDNGVDYKAYPAPNIENYVHFGFHMSKAIQVKNGAWITNVFQIKSYSPPDEELPFEINIDTDCSSTFSVM